MVFKPLTINCSVLFTGLLCDSQTKQLLANAFLNKCICKNYQTTIVRFSEKCDICWCRSIGELRGENMKIQALFSIFVRRTSQKQVSFFANALDRTFVREIVNIFVVDSMMCAWFVFRWRVDVGRACAHMLVRVPPSHHLIYCSVCNRLLRFV